VSADLTQRAVRLRQRAARAVSHGEGHFCRVAADALERAAKLVQQAERTEAAADRVRKDPGGAADADP
jgi:hypothetical protein